MKRYVNHFGDNWVMDKLRLNEGETYSNVMDELNKKRCRNL